MPEQGSRAETAGTRRAAGIMSSEGQGAEGIETGAEAVQPADRPDQGVRRAPVRMGQISVEQPTSALPGPGPQRVGLRAERGGVQLLPGHDPQAPRPDPAAGMSGKNPRAEPGRPGPKETKME